MVEGILEGTVPAAIQTTTPPPEGAGDFSVPEAYRGKPYLKDVTNIDDVYKKLDGAQALIGQKVNFPTPESTDEERLSFNKSAGMPEKAEDYAFEKLGDVERIPEVDAKVKDIFHKYGISGEAATGIQKDYEAFANEAMALKKTQDDAAFDELSGKIFGDKVDDVLASGKKLLEANMPPELVEEFGKLSNPALVIMSGVLENIRQKYISEDTITQGDGSQGVGQSKEELTKESDRLMNLPAWKQGTHQDHKKVNEQIVVISQKLAAIS